MKLFVFVLIISVAFGVELKISVNKLQEIADHVNGLQTTWQATANLSSQKQEVDWSFSMGALLHRTPGSKCCGDSEESSEEQATQCENNGLPENFDARKKWPECSSIGHIYDQGRCGSCWAVSVVSAFTDRVCIKTKGKVTALRSSQQMTSCCHKCGYGCRGGWPSSAWNYLKREGSVTGGDYNSGEGCQPYRLSPCAHYVNDTKLPLCSSIPEPKTPKCKLHCYNNKYSKTYKTDKVRVKKVYEIDPCAAQNEIQKNGPIIAIFEVYEDFVTYKSGVYQYTTGRFGGYHAVRVIGWGVENQTPYWLVTNSWNQDWGDRGTFKILRGESELLFEDFFIAGEVE